MSQIELDTGAVPDALVARPLADIDMAVTAELQAALVWAVVDLSSVEYIDSSGIELLFRLNGALGADGIELIVVAPPGSSPARLLGLVALSDIGEVRPSLAAALDTCGEREAR